MLDWDDYYQMQREKGRQVEISAALSAYKREHEAFNKEWERSTGRAAEGNVLSPTNWPNYDSK